MDPAGTHILVLKHLVEITTGPVLELGIGDNSTPILHKLCSEQCRYVLSVDNNEEWVEKYAKFRTVNHDVCCVDWNKEDWKPTDPEWARDEFTWDVALVDHAPIEQRIVDIEKLRHLARFIIVHDSEMAFYGYEPVLTTFKYRHDFVMLRPHTTVVSMSTPIPRPRF